MADSASDKNRAAELPVVALIASRSFASVRTSDAVGKALMPPLASRSRRTSDTQFSEEEISYTVIVT